MWQIIDNPDTIIEANDLISRQNLHVASNFFRFARDSKAFIEDVNTDGVFAYYTKSVGQRLGAIANAIEFPISLWRDVVPKPAPVEEITWTNITEPSTILKYGDVIALSDTPMLEVVKTKSHDLYSVLRGYLPAAVYSYKEANERLESYSIDANAPISLYRPSRVVDFNAAALAPNIKPAAKWKEAEQYFGRGKLKLYEPIKVNNAIPKVNADFINPYSHKHKFAGNPIYAAPLPLP